MLTDQSTQSADFNRGVVLAFFAYGLWGFVPIYFRLLDAVPVFEVIAHRVIWSMATLGLFLVIVGRLPEVSAACRNWRVMALLALAALANGANWLLFVWAIDQYRVLEVSFGYFINPLVSVLFGVMFLAEKLSTGQRIAVAIAASAVVLQAIEFGRPPYISLTLAVTFAIYGLLKKKTDVRPVPGLFIETLMLLPPSCVLLAYLARHGNDVIYVSDPTIFVLLIGTGLATIMPLLLFTAASRRLPLTILGMMQYIAPSLHLLVAIFLFGEEMSLTRLISFAIIWMSLIVFTVDLGRRQKAGRSSKTP